MRAFAAVFVFSSGGECCRRRNGDNTAYTVWVPNLHTSFYLNILEVIRVICTKGNRIYIERSLLSFSSATRTTQNKKGIWSSSVMHNICQMTVSNGWLFIRVVFEAVQKFDKSCNLLFTGKFVSGFQVLSLRKNCTPFRPRLIRGRMTCGIIDFIYLCKFCLFFIFQVHKVPKALVYIVSWK